MYCLTHSLEHLTEPHITLNDISNKLRENALFINSIPNLKEWMRKGQPNALNQEHTYLLSEKHYEQCMLYFGFEVIDKCNFDDFHSIFYCHKKVHKPKQSPLVLDDLIESQSKLYENYIKSFSMEAERINNILKDHKLHDEIFIFGAHVFSQYLLVHGLHESWFSNVLDNNPSKENKRLYGTNLICKSPSVLANRNQPTVVIRAGSYTNEIRKQILKINDQTIFIT